MLQFYDSMDATHFGRLKKYENLEQLYKNLKVYERPEEDSVGKGVSGAHRFIPVLLTPAEEIKRKAIRKQIRGKETVTHMTMFFADVDNVFDPAVIKTAERNIKKLGYSAIIVPSQSFMKPNASGHRRFNFRVFFELSEYVEAGETWKFTYQAIENALNFGVPLDCRFAITLNQYALAPYKTKFHFENNITIKTYFIPGKPIDISAFKGAVEALRSEANLVDAQKDLERLQKREALKEVYGGEGFVYDGIIRSDIAIIHQLNFAKIPIEAWEKYLNSQNISTEPVEANKIVFECDSDIHEHNATEAFILLSEEGMPVFHCSHATCPYGSGEGATTRWLEAHRETFPKSWVRGKRVKASENITKLNSFEYCPDATPKKVAPPTVKKAMLASIYELEEDPSKFLESDDKFAAGEYPTGCGKTYADEKYAIKCAEAGDKILIILPNKKAIVDVISDLRQLLLEQGKTEEQIYDFHITALDAAHGETIKQNMKIIVTHYYYLKRRGDSDKMYSIVRWAYELHRLGVPPICLCDEFDEMFTILAGSIELNGRYMRFKNKETKKNKCPNFSGHRYQCERCEFRDELTCNIEAFYNLGMPGTVTSQKPDFTRARVDNMPELNDIAFTRTVHKSTIHELKCDFLRSSSVENLPLDPASGLPEGSFEMEEYDNSLPEKWVRHIVEHSLFAYVVHAAESDRKKEYGAIAEAATKTFYRNGLDENVKGGEGAVLTALASYKTACVHKAILAGDVPSYPYHPCGVKTLKFFDTFAFSTLMKYCKKVRFTSATVSENQRAAMNKLVPELKWYGGKNPKFKAVDDLMVVTVATEIALINNHEQMAADALARVKTVEVGGIERTTNKTLYFAGSEKEIKNIKVANQDHKDGGGLGVGIYEGFNMVTDFGGRKTGCVATFVRSQLGRGVNLGEFSTVFVDYRSMKPMLHYDFSSAKDLDSARATEQATLTSQACGRIMRKAMALENGKLRDLEGEGMHRRLMVVSGCSQELAKKDEEGKNIVQDLAEKVSNSLINPLKKMVKNPVEQLVIEDKDFWDEDDLWRILSAIQKSWDLGKKEIPPIRIPAEVFKCKTYVSACKKFPRLKKVMGSKEFVIKTLEINLAAFKLKFHNLEKAERRRKSHYARWVNKIPVELKSKYNNFFEEE